MGNKFAVIDTETNWANEVMSIGIVISEDYVFTPIEGIYIIIPEAARVGGLYYGMLNAGSVSPVNLNRNAAISTINTFLRKHGVDSLFAYNASFDMTCLPELSGYSWHDILKLAAYKQYNPFIPNNADCCSTGRLKRGYKVEDILQLCGETGYCELHNALTDAVDELRLMAYLNLPINKYP